MTATAFRSPRARQAVLASYDRILGQWQTPYDERDLSTSFGTTHVIEAGNVDAPPIVLLHGGGGNSAMWFPNVATLAPHAHLFAVDIIGEMGKSDDRRQPFGADHHAQWLVEVLDQLSLDRPTLLGTSLGATLAIQLALASSERIGKLILVSPPSLAKMRGGFALRGLAALLMPTRMTSRWFYRYITSANAPEPPPWALEDLWIRNRAQRLDTRPIPVLSDAEITRLPGETLLLLGRDDPIYGAEEEAKRVAELAPNAITIVINNAGHVTSVEQPTRFGELVVDFVRSRSEAAEEAAQPST